MVKQPEDDPYFPEDTDLAVEGLTPEEIAESAERLIADSIKALRSHPHDAAEIRRRAAARLAMLPEEEQARIIQTGRESAYPKRRINNTKRQQIDQGGE